MRAGYKLNTIAEQINTIYNLGMGATGCGYIEIWEWQKLRSRLQLNNKTSIPETELTQLLETCRNVTEWGTAMFMAIYKM